ncbi:methyltransferase domain-containing protein [bacterium]|nr:methyltransferase domain-containing protein [bacterium]
MNKRYQWHAEEYGTHSSAQIEWGRELIPKLKLQGDESVLDLGCGHGKISAEIARFVPHGTVLGIDSSQEMIDSAVRQYPQNDFPNLSFQRVDIQEMVFENQFDVVFSNAALHWIKDHLSVLYRVHQGMKQSGRLLFQMGGRGNGDGILSVLNGMLASRKWKFYFEHFDFLYGFYGPDVYQKWLIQAGLIPERIELVLKDMKQKGASGLAGWIRTTWLPYTERIPEDLRETFISEIVDTYLSLHPLDGDGFAHVNMIRLEVEAWKSV